MYRVRDKVIIVNPEDYLLERGIEADSIQTVSVVDTNIEDGISIDYT